MGSKRKRADEVIPKLHFRPGVNDPELEATIVGFYRPREIVASLFPALPQETDKGSVSDGKLSESTVDHEIKTTVDLIPASTVDSAPRSTVDGKPASTVDLEVPDTGDVEPPSTGAPGSPGAPAPAPAGPGPAAEPPRAAVDWYTESPRNFFPAKRVRKITLAQDALSLTEEIVRAS